MPAPAHALEPAELALYQQVYELLGPRVVRPDLVVEIAFNDLQASPRYPGKLALRFARVKRFRPDKSADEADTIETVRHLYSAQVHAAGTH